MEHEHCDSYKEIPSLPEEIEIFKNVTNVSSPVDFYHQRNVSDEWLDPAIYLKTNFLVISSAICLLTSALTSPLVLLAIFSKSNLRQATRYLLLANMLISDLIYSVLNTLIGLLNTQYLTMPKEVCETLLYGLTVSYSTGILTVTMMVVDTYVAVSRPFRYTTLLSFSRTLKVIVCIWLLSAIAPSAIYIITIKSKHDLLSTLSICILPLIFSISSLRIVSSTIFYSVAVLYFLICLILISSCYVMLYYNTRSSGIWARNSRARQTYLIHTILLFLSFFPLLLLATAGILEDLDVIGFQSEVWMSLSMSNIFMMIPKVVSPYIYALRYREIATIIRSFSIFRCLNRVPRIS
ncbi:probable G-protein coupled receptor 148 [Callorhinchus milii]|uniref:probable G-protein coupled receptor 148 n=1 Tax=Callorhinchus milii TaxID=7868 RepID=UPI001C3FA51E|nr:probable G-protein coupled receptor 148 [Callorhinchus milii]